MRAWLHCLLGLIVWAGHFFGLYFIASFFPGTQLARWLSLVLTVLAFGLLILFVTQIWKRSQSHSSKVEGWLNSLAGLGTAMAAVGIVFQVLPAVIS